VTRDDPHTCGIGSAGAQGRIWSEAYFAEHHGARLGFRTQAHELAISDQGRPISIVLVALCLTLDNTAWTHL